MHYFFHVFCPPFADFLHFIYRKSLLVGQVCQMVSLPCITDQTFSRLKQFLRRCGFYFFSKETGVVLVQF